MSKPKWRRIVRLAVAAVLVVVPIVGAAPAHAQSADEQINVYRVVVKIARDGTLEIHESITYDFGVVPHHGLLRDIVEREHLADDTRHDRRYRIHVESVTADAGTPSAVKQSTNGPYLRLRIGDPDRTITGVHTYQLVYTVRGAPLSFPDHDELYWDVIGNQWSVPIQNAHVEVDAPAAITRVACYSGPAGSLYPCDASATGRSATFAARSLGTNSGLTAVVAMPAGTIVPTPKTILEKRRIPINAFELTTLTGSLGGGLTIVGLGGVALLATRRGRDRRFTGGAVDAAMGNTTGEEEPVPLLHRESGPVEFVPPEGIRPGQIGTLVDERANLLDVTASIVDLAVRGWLRIAEVDPGAHERHPDYELTATPGEGKGTALPYEQLLVHELFDNRASVKLSDLKYKFRASLGEVQSAMYDDTVTQGWYRIRPDRTRTIWTAIGVLTLAAGIGLTVLFAKFTFLAIIPLSIVITGFALWGTAARMPARTGAGTAMLSRVRGFRQLFDEGEEDTRARFAEQHEIFSQYLPYAIVFGCTKKWAKAFEGIAADQIDSSWYVGNQPFNALVLANAVDHFGTTATGTMYASMPSSSSSSGFSGGSSGGGGGGGGGGSW